MTFWSVLSSFVIGPLKLLFEVIFQAANWLVSSPGVAIIFLSLCMNLLVLPLYRRADAMQEQARDRENELRPGISHIKKTFSGNERFMMLQAYYRQNNYSPTNALRGSASLILEIPFFMAAYQFLSSLPILQGVSFGPIPDLGKPDGMLYVFGLHLNLLPILMTVINVVSAAIYLKGFPLKTKIQLYAMAAFFLFFLYTSPSGLVFYWTLNNVFSLVKNIFYKLKNPKRVLAILLALCGAGLIVLFFATSGSEIELIKRQIALLAGILFFIPAVLLLFLPKKDSSGKPGKTYVPNRTRFLLPAAFLTAFIGLLIPTTFLAASPQEYVDVTYFFHPLWYALNALCLAGGTFLLWFGVFYWLASPKGKVIFEHVMWIFSACAVIDFMFFGTDQGILSSTLQYETGLSFSVFSILINLGLVAFVAFDIYLVLKRWPKIAQGVLGAALAALLAMSGLNIHTTAASVNEIRLNDSDYFPNFTLSKGGKNVIVVFLDRALGEDLPYLLQEKPELVDLLDGFTYYSNCISFGGHTNYGAPPLMGGYEYTPVEMNKRDTELLVDKHNESLKIMPYLFSDAGYQVTVCDAPYANYKWIPDLSIYDERPEIRKFITKGFFGSPEMKQRTVESDLRNFFCFSLMKSLPLFVQYTLYDSGDYHMIVLPDAATTQERDGTSKSVGLHAAFMESYDALINLKTMTKISDGEENTYLFYYNDTPHEPMLLEEPDYVPAAVVDNTAYDEAHADRFTLPDGSHIRVESDKAVIHYESNMATLLRIGDWLTYLKESGVYDNSRIILCSDHGYYLYQSRQLLFSDHKLDYGQYFDAANFFPLLMVKDFDAHGFTTDDSFMTNADVPSLAFEGIIENPVNPFTGKAINMDEKYAHDQFIVTEHKNWSTTTNNGTCFNPATWAAVSSDLWDRSDWQFIDEKIVLKEHEMPQ